MILPSALSTRDGKGIKKKGQIASLIWWARAREEDFQFPFSDLKIARKIFFFCIFTFPLVVAASFVRDLGPSGSYEISAQSFYTVDEVLLLGRSTRRDCKCFLSCCWWAVADEVIFSFSFSVFRRDEEKKYSTSKKKSQHIIFSRNVLCVGGRCEISRSARFSHLKIGFSATANARAFEFDLSHGKKK